MIYAIRKPDGTIHPVPADSMASAQNLIAILEPDVVEQGKWQIHPIAGPDDAERLKINLIWKLRLEKFDGVTGELVETVEREGVN